MARKKKEEKTPEEKALARERQLANLISTEEINSRLTPEEMHEKMSMMGKASAAKKRESRMMMEFARKLLNMPISDNQPQLKIVLSKLGIPEGEMNYNAALVAMMLGKAMNGDINAAKFVRDSAGVDAFTVLKEEQLEYMKENGQNVNVTLDGELTTKSRVQIYLPERDPDPE